LPKNIRNHRHPPSVISLEISFAQFKQFAKNSSFKNSAGKNRRLKRPKRRRDSGLNNSQKVAAAKVGFHLTDRN
jgi:hypothetical protein